MTSNIVCHGETHQDMEKHICHGETHQDMLYGTT